MGKQFISVRTVVAVGIGAALLFVLMRFAAVPSGIPNTNLNLGIAIVTIFAAIFGPVAGFLIGLIGHTLVDLTFGFGIWWSWVIADAVYGFLIGLFRKTYKIDDGKFTVIQAVYFNLIQIAANAVAWVGIAPLLDVFIHREPADKAFLQGLVAGGLNAGVVLILGTLLAFGYSAARVKSGSLKAE
jgi:energy-coupling factor transport system substrate-specific component